MVSNSSFASTLMSGQVSAAQTRVSESQLQTRQRGIYETLMQGAEDPNARIDATAKDFESVFITQMLQMMFEDVDAGDLYGGGVANDTMKSMMIDQYGTVIANTGGIGIADAVRRELIALQSQGSGKGHL